MSPARAYAKRVAAKLFERFGNRGMFAVGEVERLLWRAFNDGARAKVGGDGTTMNVRLDVQPQPQVSIAAIEAHLPATFRKGISLAEARPIIEPPPGYRLSRIIDATRGVVEFTPLGPPPPSKPDTFPSSLPGGQLGKFTMDGPAVTIERHKFGSFGRIHVHHMHNGFAACGFPSKRRLVVPRDWPAGHQWSADWNLVNCRDCLRSERAKVANPRPVLQAEPRPGTIDTWPKRSRSSPRKRKPGSGTTSGTRNRKRSRRSS